MKRRSWIHTEKYLPGLPPCLHIDAQTDMYLYVPIDTRNRNSYFDEKRKQHASQGNDASTAEPHPAESGEASKVRHDE